MGQFLKKHSAISSSWPGLDLRLCPWRLLFWYWTDGSALTWALISLSLFPVSLVMVNEWEEGQGVTKRCPLSWLTNSAIVYEPKCGGMGGGGGFAGSQSMSTVELSTWSPNKLWRSNSKINLWVSFLQIWGSEFKYTISQSSHQSASVVCFIMDKGNFSLYCSFHDIEEFFLTC